MSVLHTRDWPGPSAFDEKEPDVDDVGAHAKWSAAKLRFEMNCFAAKAYNDQQMTEAEVNLRLYERFGKRLAQGSIWKLVERCKTFNPKSKRVHGFWACVPRYRPTKLRDLDSPLSTNPVHGLSQLFRQYPHIEAKLVTFIVKRTTGKQEMRPVSVMDPEMVWDTFIALCKAEGMHLAPKRWPFTAKKRGYEAIRLWYHDKKYRNPSAAAFNELNESIAKAVRAANNSVNVPKIAAELGMAYSRTELDEHMFDAEFTMFIPGEGPDQWIAVPQGRIYVLVHIECETKVILSADMAVDGSFTGDDVKSLIYDSVLPPPRPRSFRIEHPEWEHAEGACFPAELPEFQRCTWQSLSLDRAMQHRAGNVRDAIERVTGCELAFDKPAEALSRQVIEGFFKRLANFARWLEAATGNSPDSPSRRDSAGGAVRSRLTLPLAREMLQLFCRNYNVTKLKGTGRSPLGALLDRLRQDRCFIGRVGEQGFNNMYQLLHKEEAVLCERVARTHGPVCIYLGYEYYLGPELSSRHELLDAVDRAVDVFIQRDARFGYAVPRAFPEHVFRIVLCGPWAAEPHTLKWRRLVKRMAANGWFEDHTEKPLLGFGAAQGLGRAAATDAGLAQLLSGYYLFADQYGRGEVQYFDLAPAQRAELLKWVGAEAVVDMPPPYSEPAPMPSQAAPDLDASAAQRAPRAPHAPDLDDEYGIVKD